MWLFVTDNLCFHCRGVKCFTNEENKRLLFTWLFQKDSMIFCFCLTGKLHQHGQVFLMVLWICGLWHGWQCCHSKKVWELNPPAGYEESLPVAARALRRGSSFLPQSKAIQVRLTGDSRLAVGVNVSVNGSQSLCVSLVRDWWRVQGLRPMTPKISSSPSPTPERKENGFV